MPVVRRAIFLEDWGSVDSTNDRRCLTPRVAIGTSLNGVDAVETLLRRTCSVIPHAHTQAHTLRSHTHITPRPKERQRARTPALPLPALEREDAAVAQRQSWVVVLSAKPWGFSGAEIERERKRSCGGRLYKKPRRVPAKPCVVIVVSGLRGSGMLDKTEIVVVVQTRPRMRPRTDRRKERERETSVSGVVASSHVRVQRRRSARLSPRAGGQSEAASTGARHGPLFRSAAAAAIRRQRDPVHRPFTTSATPPSLPPPHHPESEGERERIKGVENERVRRPIRENETVSAVVARRALLFSRSEQVCGAAAAGVQERQHHAVGDRVRVAPAPMPSAAGFSATTAGSPPLTLLRRRWRLQCGARRRRHAGVGGGR